MNVVAQELREVYRYRAMLQSMVATQLRSRYKGSVLGFLWTFLNPVMSLVVYTVVFSFIMPTRQKDYAMFLFVGLMPWQYHAQSLMIGVSSLVTNAGLVKKVYFPRSVLPISVVLGNLMNFLFGMGILIPALLISGVKASIAWVAFPAVLAIHTLFLMGLVLLVSVANVYFRDLEHTLGVLVNMWFFLTPVFYSLDLVPPKVRPFFMLNPATPIIDSYRSVLFYGYWPRWGTIAWLVAGFSLFLVVSFVVFARAQRNVAEVL